jgi:hypothetical protein
METSAMATNNSSKKTPTSTTPETFGDYAGAGFFEHLIPIIPPTATISKMSNPSVKAGRGKIPGKQLQDDTWVGFMKWTQHVAGFDNIMDWDAMGAGVGIQTRAFPAIDIDVLDSDVADATEDLAKLYLGDAPTRYGNAPKRLLMYRWSDPENPGRKRRVAFTLPGSQESHAVEILGHGQQFVAEGIHPKTGNPYYWDQGQSPVSVGAAGLEQIDEDTVDGFVDSLIEYIASIGGTVTSGGSGKRKALNGARSNASPTRHPLDWFDFKAPSDAELIKVVEEMPNEYDYDGWIAMTAAIKAAAHDQEAVYPAYEEFSLRYGGTTPDDARAKWDSIQDSSVGADYVFSEARRLAGYQDQAVRDFGGGAANANEGIEQFVDKWAFYPDRQKFIQMVSGQELSKVTFDSIFATPERNVGSSTKKTSARYMSSTGKTILVGEDFRPNQGVVIQDGNKHLANMWRTPAITPRIGTTDEDAKQFIQFMKYLVPDRKDRKALLDWLAHLIQCPDQRVNWHPLLLGPQGIGKTTLIDLTAQYVGDPMVGRARNEDIFNRFNAWAAGKMLIILEEVQQVGHRGYSNLKELLANETIPIERKGRDREGANSMVRNFSRAIMASNDPGALAIDPDDRRVMVIKCADNKWPQARFARFHAWLEMNRDVVFGYLINRKIGNFDPKAAAPQTAAKSEMAAIARDDLETLICEDYEARRYPFDTPFLRATDASQHYGSRLSDRKRVTAGNILRILERNYPGKIHKLSRSRDQNQRLHVIRDGRYYHSLADQNARSGCKSALYRSAIDILSGSRDYVPSNGQEWGSDAFWRTHIQKRVARALVGAGKVVPLR